MSGVRIALFCACVVLIAMAFAAPAIDAPGDTFAVKAFTTIHTAQVQYYSSYNRFASTLQELGPPATGAESPSAAGLIERDLANGEKRGYKFTLQATPAGYSIYAVPIQFAIFGGKTYFSDQNMRIHVRRGREPATADDPLIDDGAPQH